ncbi:MAG: VapE domain-containing protein [Methyloligellaceae bacterium]
MEDYGKGSQLSVHLQQAYRQQALSDIEQKVSQLSGLKDGRNQEGFSAMRALGKYVVHCIISEEEFSSLFYQAYRQNGLLGKIGHQAFTSTVKRALLGCLADDLPKLGRNFTDTTQKTETCSVPIPLTQNSTEKSKLFYDQSLLEQGYQLTQTYQFYDEAKRAVFQKLRYERECDEGGLRDKKFLVRHQGADGLWYAGRGPGPDYPYRLPEILKDQSSVILVCEGEKDADTAHALGLLAVSVNNWKDCIDYFQNRDVVLIPDNDQAGQKRAQSAHLILQPVSKSCLLLELPDLPEKGDFTDWVEAGGTPETLKALIDAARLKISQPSGSSKSPVSRNMLANILRKRNIQVAYNQLNDLIDLTGLEGFTQFSDQAANRLRFDLWEYEGIRISKDVFHDIIADIALGNAYHPIKEYLNGLQWDGLSRIDRFFIDLAGACDFPLTRSITQIWFIAAVRRIFEPGADYQELVILEGPQGHGKSTAIRKLCPDISWYSDDLPLDAPTKTVVEQTLGKWIIEASELAGRTHNMRTLKRFLSATTDRTRLSYERLSRDYPRQWIPIGTTNEAEYLVDSTGNRRYWPIRIETFDLDRLTPDYRDQLWAEAVHLHRQGLSLKLAPELWDSARREQDKRFNSDPWEDIIRNLLPGTPCSIAVSSVLEALSIPQERRSRRASNRVAYIMRKLGFRKSTARHPVTGKVMKVWVFKEGGPVKKLTFTGLSDCCN